MSRVDAPNLREVDPDKSCRTCNFFGIDYGVAYYKVRCRKHDFVIIDSCKLVCDDWMEDKK